jgi:hypothetical protein
MAKLIPRRKGRCVLANFQSKGRRWRWLGRGIVLRGAESEETQGAQDRQSEFRLLAQPVGRHCSGYGEDSGSGFHPQLFDAMEAASMVITAAVRNLFRLKKVRARKTTVA